MKKRTTSNGSDWEKICREICCLKLAQLIKSAHRLHIFGIRRFDNINYFKIYKRISVRKFCIEVDQTPIESSHLLSLSFSPPRHHSLNQVSSICSDWCAAKNMYITAMLACWGASANHRKRWRSFCANSSIGFCATAPWFSSHPAEIPTYLTGITTQWIRNSRRCLLDWRRRKQERRSVIRFEY